MLQFKEICHSSTEVFNFFVCKNFNPLNFLVGANFFCSKISINYIWWSLTLFAYLDSRTIIDKITIVLKIRVISKKISIHCITDSKLYFLMIFFRRIFPAAVHYSKYAHKSKNFYSTYVHK